MGLLDETYAKAKALAGLLSDAYQTGAQVYFPNEQDVKARPELAKGLLQFVPGPGDVISGYDAVQSAKQGNYGEAALNGVGLLPFIPAMGGMVRGVGNPKLSYDQLLAVNKGRGMLTKRQRKGLFDTESGVSIGDQLQAIGSINNEISGVRLARSESKKGMDATEWVNQQRNYASQMGVLSDMLDVYKHTPATHEQAYFSALRGKEIAELVAKQEESNALMKKNLEYVFSAPSSPMWHKKIADQLRDEVAFHTQTGGGSIFRNQDIDALGRQATLEAITREAKKRGLEMDYLSAQSTHSGGSHYLKTPDGRVVRVSDHELPDTPQREFNRAQGLTGRWDDEVIVNDWRSSSIDDYLNRIIHGTGNE